MISAAYLLVIALFVLLTGFRLLAPGMFLDGVTYAAVSRNLAAGQGSFWEPYFTSTLYPRFHEHPPLAIGMESIAFRIFGDHLWVERLYSFGTFIVTGFLIVKVWESVTGDRKSGWLPLLVWTLFPLVTWAAASNLLDNTLCIFTTLAILLILYGIRRQRPFWLAIAGLSLFAGILVKGPFALFPWTMPLLMGFTRNRQDRNRAALNTLILILATLVPLVLLLILSPAARDSLQQYWTGQVARSLAGVRTVGSRWYIAGVLLLQLAVPVLMALAATAFSRRKNIRGKWPEWGPPAARWFLLGLSGVLPILISLKQSSFYILSALPAFAIPIALYLKILTPFDRWTASLPETRKSRMAAIGLLVLSMALSPGLARLNGKDRNEIETVRTVGRFVPPGGKIGIPADAFSDWSLHSYFMRLANISLDPSTSPESEFYLTREPGRPPTADPSTAQSLVQINGYQLFRK